MQESGAVATRSPSCPDLIRASLAAAAQVGMPGSGRGMTVWGQAPSVFALILTLMGPSPGMTTSHLGTSLLSAPGISRMGCAERAEEFRNRRFGLGRRPQRAWWRQERTVFDMEDERRAGRRIVIALRAKGVGCGWTSSTRQDYAEIAEKCTACGMLLGWHARRVWCGRAQAVRDWRHTCVWRGARPHPRRFALDLSRDAG